MGALQPGLLSPAIIPSHWPIVVIDIKDYFFNITLDPRDSRRFAFTVPSINAVEPSRHFHWTILPQGMRNSPSVCQRVIADVLTPVHRQFPMAILYHFMDDILLAAESQELLTQVYLSVKAALSTHGLEITPGKEQVVVPWKYLGFKINTTTIQPQTVALPNKICTLNDLHSLLGLINWVRPILGITADTLEPLLQLLKGEWINSPRHLTPKAQEVSEEIDKKLSSCQSRRKVIGLPVMLVIL
ncbi:endogenous retrovirus group K member 18 Pol protein-like protein [Willisornis vidua]|uniref:ribonuclease H n=1 Tax=Willisornis vidua TaxID=1566151 RepID=A0ABQ9DXL9_9PASS|nr:endogenous retrovirus group K member 18 Pol protein-like protein [Willisornis vidua]